MHHQMDGSSSSSGESSGGSSSNVSAGPEILSVLEVTDEGEAKYIFRLRTRNMREKWLTEYVLKYYSSTVLYKK